MTLQPREWTLECEPHDIVIVRGLKAYGPHAELILHVPDHLAGDLPAAIAYFRLVQLLRILQQLEFMVLMRQIDVYIHMHTCKRIDWVHSLTSMRMTVPLGHGITGQSISVGLSLSRTIHRLGVACVWKSQWCI